MTRGLRVSGSIWPLLAALGCCLPSLGHISAQGLTGGQADAAPHTIRGTVVNSVTGEPIYRALVQIGGQYAALTDHEGRFEFDGVVSAEMPPWAMKPGYFFENRFTRFGGFGIETITESPGTPANDALLVVKLVPEAMVTGTVTGQDGAPLEGIPVQLKFLSVQDGLLRWRQRQATTTNSEGQYRFAELEAGKYAVTTGFHTEGLADSQGALAYVPARYPGDGPSSVESAIVLKPGDHSQADLSPKVEKLYAVTGTIAGYGEGRGVSFRVQTGGGEEIAPMSRFIARTGEFRLLLPGGSYQVTATAYLREGPLEARREVTVPQAPVSGVSFAMDSYASLPVEVELDTVNQPTEGSGPVGSFPNEAASISLTGTDESGVTPSLFAQPQRRRGAGDAGSGPLTIENVSPGRYILQAQPQPPWYVSSASCGSIDLTREELAIAGGAAGCSIRVVLRNDSGSVHVTLRSAAAGPTAANRQQAVVYLAPIGDLVRHVSPTFTSGQDFTMSGVAPGRYLVLALSHGEELPYRDAEAMKKYAGLGKEITVPPNGKADVEVGLAVGEP